MNPYQISQDPAWHRWIEGLIVLFIGIAAGVTIASALMVEETTTVNTLRRVQTAPQVESGVSTEEVLPKGVKIDEI